MQEKIRQIIREEIKLILEERGLTKQFDKTVTLYHDLTKQIQDEISKFKTEYPKSNDKESYKKKYIERMKPLQDKLKKAEQEYNSALRNLPDPEDDDFL